MPTTPRPRPRPRTRRRRNALAVIGIATMVAAACVSSPAVFVVGGNGAHASSGPSCGAAVRKANGTYWTCTFDDEFSSGLNTANWTVVKTATTNFHTGPECYVNDPRHVNVAMGMLTLTATKSAVPVSCGRFATPYLSGMVTTSGLFAQAYGRWEIRAKLPNGVGLQPALWMNPQRLVYGAWPRSGEIDIAEGLVTGSVSPHLHYMGSDGSPAAPGTYCAITPNRFHKYDLVWSPSSMTFTIDGSPCWSVSGWRPAAPLHNPAPFDQPFTLLLQLALGYMAGNAVQAATPLPASIKVDYVRVWK